jgi:hypothetical protein
MNFVDVSSLVRPGIIPKIGDAIGIGILQKIQRDKPLDALIVDGSNTYLVYHNAPQYWIRAMNFMPEFSNEKGATVSPHGQEVRTGHRFFSKDVHELCISVRGERLMVELVDDFEKLREHVSYCRVVGCKIGTAGMTNESSRNL